MIKFLFFSLLLLTSSAGLCQAQIVGVVDAYGVPTYTFSNTAELLSSWNELIQNGTGIDAGLTQVSIIRTGGDYRLIARGTDYKSSTLLTLNSNTQELAIAAPGGIKTTCTTKACATNTGCEAQQDGTCSACALQGGAGACAKSTTTSSYLF